ncbi:hypothetical protein BDAP_001417 [Binucleata daphniae]
MLKKLNDIELNEKVSDIIKLQKEINQNMEDIEFYKEIRLKKALENKILLNFIILACESDYSAQETYEVKKEEKKIHTIASIKNLSLTVSTEYLKKFIKENKPEITKILSNTVELKGRIMEAEQQASFIVANIKAYKNADNNK